MKQLSDIFPSIDQSSMQVQQVMLSGVEKCGKTSIAFRLAYEEACKGGVPLFISKSFQAFPTNVVVMNVLEYEAMKINHELKLSNSMLLPDALNRIKLKYVTSHKDLLELIVGLHSFQPLPTMIVIDDFDTLAETNWESNLLIAQQKQSSSGSHRDRKFESCYVLNAFLQDTVNFMSSSLRKVVLVMKDRDLDMHSFYLKLPAVQYRLNLQYSAAKDWSLRWHSKEHGGERDLGKLKFDEDAALHVLVAS